MKKKKDKWVCTHTHPARKPRSLNRKPLHPELLGKHELIYGRCGDHSVVWRALQPVC